VPALSEAEDLSLFLQLLFLVHSLLMSHCTPVVPPDLPDILFPLLSHLVQMVRLYGVACQSPFGCLCVTAGPVARERPPTFPAHGH